MQGRDNMKLPHENIWDGIGSWYAKNRFIIFLACVLDISACILRFLFSAPDDTRRRSSGAYYQFNNFKLYVIPDMRLRSMPRTSMGEVDTKKYPIRRHRNKLYLNPDAKVTACKAGNNTIRVGKLPNGKFVMSCLKDNLPIIKNTWFTLGSKISKIKNGKYIREELAKKAKLEKSAARKLRAEKKLAAQKVERARLNALNYNNRPNQNRNGLQFPQGGCGGGLNALQRRGRW